MPSAPPVWRVHSTQLGPLDLGDDGEEPVDAIQARQRVRVEATTTAWRNSTPVRVLQGPYHFPDGPTTSRTYDIAPDGKRFLMITGGDGERATSPSDLIVVQNWFEELKRLAPPSR